MTSRSSTASRRVPRGEYIETDSGNKVSRRAQISGTQNITLAGKTVVMADCQLRGDLVRLKAGAGAGAGPDGADAKSTAATPAAASTAIAIGRCTIISTGAILRPPARLSRGKLVYFPLRIGDNVFVGPGSRISAADVKSHVHIGAGAVLGDFCIVREGVKILPGAVVPENMVVPPGVVVGGRPARIVGEVGVGWGVGASAAGGKGEVLEGGDLRELVRAIR